MVCTSGVMILQKFLIGLQCKNIYSKFISKSPLRRMPNAKNMFIMLTAIFAIDISFILQNITMVVLYKSAYLVIPVVFGLPVYLSLSLINLLVIGSSCTLLTNLAENNAKNVERDVAELVLLYKMYQESVSFHLFVTYSLSTVQLIVFLYMFAITVPCMNAEVIDQLYTKDILYLYL